MATFSALHVLNDDPPVKPHYRPGNPAILKSFIFPMVKNYIITTTQDYILQKRSYGSATQLSVRDVRL
jgi:hypothetical protein